MFTGIIEEIGKVASIRRSGESACIVLSAHKVLEGTKVGDSISVNGICLTVTSLSASSFTADAMPETLKRSNLANLAFGDEVNLERALLPTTRLGGHIVSGHIDGVAKVMRIKEDSNSYLVSMTASSQIMRYIVEKGSVALNGVSLTVVQVGESEFTVSLIPHTFATTTFKNCKIETLLNVECDIIGKYVERLMLFDQQPAKEDLTFKRLAELGFC